MTRPQQWISLRCSRLPCQRKRGPRRRENAPERNSQGGGYEDKKQQEDRQERYRLLGALPSLGPRANEEDVKVALALELPTDLGKAAKNNNSSSKVPVNASSGSPKCARGSTKGVSLCY